MTIVKQAVFSIAFAVAAVAIAEFTAWLLEQNALDKPVNAFVVGEPVKRRAELAGEIERTHEALTATIKRRIWIAPRSNRGDARYAE